MKTGAVLVADMVIKLLHLADTRPDHSAYVYLSENGESKQLTYLQLADQVRAVANHLVERTCVGDRVVLLYPAGLDFLVAFLACLYAGVIAVPVYPPRNKRHWPRIKKVLDNADSHLVMTTVTAFDKLRNWLATEQLDVVDQIIASDNLYQNHSIAKVDAAPRHYPVALLQYTSGSTSEPKGVVVSHGNLSCNLAILQQCCQLTERDSSLSWMPHYHDMGLIDGYLLPLYVGYTGYLMAPATFIQAPMVWLQALSRYAITHSGAPNFAFDLAARTVDQVASADLDLSNLRTVLNGAEPIQAGCIEYFARALARFGYAPQAHRPGYGLAESTLLVTDSGYGTLPLIRLFERSALQQGRGQVTTDPALGQRLVSSGRAALGVDIKIVDATTAQRLAANQVGEIWLAGETVTQGYWHDDAKTQAIFGARSSDQSPTDAGEYLRSGDIGFLDESGQLFVTGRLKDVIIVDGCNYYPQDIELTAVQAHTALAPNAGAAIVIADEHDLAGQLVLIQEVKRTERHDLEPQAIFAQVAGSISELYGLKLSRLVLVKPGSIEKTSSGKIQRSGCRQKLLQNQLSVLLDLDVSVLYAQPLATPTRTLTAVPENGALRPWLRRKIGQILGLTAAQSTALVDARPLREYGLTSRQAVSLSGQLGEYVGRPLDGTLIYQYATIDALVQHLSTAHETPQKLATSALSYSAINAALAAKRSEPIAIVAMTCRFPGASSIDDFWRLLVANEDAVKLVDPRRWDSAALTAETPRQAGKLSSSVAGFIEGIDQFDAEFFGISPREANAMDPQQRLLLELAWEALEAADLVREELAGSDTGVFVAISTHDYDELAGREHENISAYCASGNAFSIAANRISYCFDFKGPSMAIDSACSSSLVALHQACRSLQSGDCSTALVGGVNLLLAPSLSIGLSQAEMLSPTGACRTFSDDADGYVRAEGAAMLVLQPLSLAQANNSPIVAIIDGSAVGQDGRSNGLTAPNGLAQQRVIRAALDSAGCSAREISFIEAHGTGTPLGDPIELAAINELVESDMAGQSRAQPCWVGSVKTNVGHLEAAAGMAGVIKSVLALQHRQLPGTMHFRSLNPLINLGPHVAVAERNVALQADAGGELRAGVSSFGFGGSNAHVVLRRAPESAPSVTHGQESLHGSDGRSPWPLLLPVSAACEAALVQRLGQVINSLAEPARHLPTLVRQWACKRSHLAQRVVVSGTNAEQLQNQLQLALAERQRLPLLTNEHLANEPTAGEQSPPHDISAGCVFVFSGQGNHWTGMARDLMAYSAVFRDTFNEIEEQVQALAGWSLVASLEQSPPSDTTAVVQPLIFAVQVAIATVLQHWGVMPRALIGHSMGEVAAAYVSGQLTLADAVRVIVARGQAMHAAHGQGAMLSVKLAAAELPEYVTRSGYHVHLAADNSLDNVVVSGTVDNINGFARWLETQAVSALPMAMPYAFHSPSMAPCAERLSASLAGLRSAAMQIPMVSTTYGGAVVEPGCDLAYWADNLVQPVHFRQGMGQLLDAGFRHFIEISPHGVLCSAMRAGLRERGLSGLVLATLSRTDKTDTPVVDSALLLPTIKACYQAGMTLNWRNINADTRLSPDAAEHYPLPPYPWQRQRYWHAHLGEHHAATEGASVQIAAAVSQWSAVLDETERQSTYVPLGLELSSYGKRWAQLNTFALQGMLKTLHQLQADEPLRAGVSVAALVRHCDIKVDYQPLLERWLDHLCDAGLLRREDMTAGHSYRLASAQDSLAELYSAALEQHSADYFSTDDDRFLFDYVASCSAVLGEVLQGRFSPLELLFPDASQQLVNKLYHDWPLVQYFNSMAARACVRYLHSLSGRAQPLRILEVGAGTGGLARTLIALLAENFRVDGRGASITIEYCFSDITPMFFEQAQQRFASYDFVSFKVVDLEQPLAAQLGLNSAAETTRTTDLFDVVVGANVLHAVSDLRRTLSELNGILNVDGMILLYELTHAQPWVDISIGLIEGWGVFDDGIRGNTPLLDHQTWLDVLAQCGFGAARAFPQSEHPAEILGQHIILGQKRKAVVLNEGKTKSNTKANTKIQSDFPISADAVRSITYQLTWVQTAAEAPLVGLAGVLRSGVLIIHHNDAFAVGLQRAFERQDLPTWCAVIGARSHRHSAQSVTLAADDPVAWTDWLTAAVDAGIQHCLYLVDQRVGADDGAGLRASLVAFTRFLQVLHRPKISRGLRNITVVTRGAQSCVPPSSNVTNVAPIAQGRVHPAHASLWAMARVAQHEMPNVPLRLLDLDPEISVELNQQALFAELQARPSNRFTQIAYQNQQRWQPRLQALPLAPNKFALRADASYLVVGGLGVLGVQVVKQLLVLGARSLLLLSRTALDKAGAQQDLLTTWRRNGVHIEVANLDIGASDVPQTCRALAQLEQSLPYPLKGVVHAAGDLRGALIEKLDDSHIEQVLAAKVTGSWCLHKYFVDAGRSLDFFLLFGSASSVLAPPGQAVYAAANAYQTGLARLRREMGLAATTISWAVWQQTGDAASEVVTWFANRGLPQIGLQEGMALMTQALTCHAAEVVVLPGTLQDWQQFIPELAQDSTFTALPEALSPGANAAVPATATSIAAELRIEVAKLMAIEPARLQLSQPLLAQGLDSLMAVTLKSRIEARYGVVIATSAIMQGISIVGLQKQIENHTSDVALASNRETVVL